MSCEPMLIISRAMNPTRDIQGLGVIFVHIKQALGAGVGCASAVPVRMQSTALQKKVQTPPADTAEGPDLVAK